MVGSFPEVSLCNCVIVEVVQVDEVDPEDDSFTQISHFVELVIYPLVTDLETEVVFSNDI